MNIEHICVVRGTFAGLYAWGEGWSEEVANKWEEYWKNIKSIYWKYMPAKYKTSSGQLVNTGGSIYLHPMGFSAVIRSAGGTCPRGNDDDLEDRYGGELDELKKLCEGACEVCGGSYTQVAQAHTIENNNLRNW